MEERNAAGYCEICILPYESGRDNRNLSTDHALCPAHPRARIIIYYTWSFARVAVVRSGHA